MINQRKKGIVLVLAILFMVVMCKTEVNADVVVESKENYYHEHGKSCKTMMHNYIVNGEKGYAYIYASPDLPEIVTAVRNGTRLPIVCTYKDTKGVVWMLVNRDELRWETNNHGISGWLKQTEAISEYNTDDFKRVNEITELTFLPDFSSYQDDIYFWTYPNSNDILDTNKPKYVNETVYKFMNCYEDKEGRKWVECFSEDVSCGWICLDDPCSNSLTGVDIRMRNPDLCYEPKDPDDWEENCNLKRIDRTYIANGEKGYIKFYENPGSDHISNRVTNGTRIYISYSYQDENNKRWLYTYDTDVDLVRTMYKSGWIPEKNLVLEYGSEEFIHEHNISKNDSYDKKIQEIEFPVVLWTYPNSGVIKDIVNKRNANFHAEECELSYYTDEDGVLWAYCTSGDTSEGWINMNDPGNSSISKEDKSWMKQYKWYKAKNPSQTLKSEADKIFLFCLVALVVIITGISIKKIYSKKV